MFVGRTGLCMLALLVAVGASTDPVDRSPDQLFTHARELYLQEGPRAALPEFEKALARFREVGDRGGEAIATGWIGNCHKRFGDHALALEYLQRALTMKRELGDRLEEGKTLSHIGLVHWERGEYPQAIEHLRQSVAAGRDTGDAKLEGSALNNLSLVYDELGEYERSLEQYARALELYRAVGFPRGESDTLGNIGGVHLLLGRYREAQSHYERALAISEREGLKPSMSQDLGNLGWCHLGLGDIEAAVQSFDRALRLARDTGLRREEADWLRGRGAAFLRSGRYGEALQAFRQALETYETAGLRRELVEALNSLGDLLLLLGDAGSAETSFRRAARLAREIDHPSGVTVNLLSLGDLEWRRGRLKEAAALYREATARAAQAGDRATTAEAKLRLAFVQRDQGRLDEAQASAGDAATIAHEIEASLLRAGCLLALAEIERLRGAAEGALELYASAEQLALPSGDAELLWRLRYGRGQAFEALERYGEAVEAYRGAVATIESVRSRLREERFRAGYLEDRYEAYVALVRLQMKLGRTSEAFLSSERLRAKSYLRLLNRAEASARSGEERRREVELRERVRQLQRILDEEWRKPASERRRAAIDAFSSELAAAERSYQNLLDDMRRTDPGYAAARDLAVPPVEEIRAALPPRTALVEYVVADDGLFVFVATQHELRVAAVGLSRRDLVSKVEILRELMLRSDGALWRRPAASLAEALIDPIEGRGWLEDVERLYVVAHGILHYLPFAALPRGRGEDAPLLVERYVVAYLPAAAGLVAGRSAPQAEPMLLAVAPQRPNLAHAREEARGIAEHFPQRHSVLLGREATESSFRALAGRYPLLHLATHGYFNKANPLLSGLELEPDDGHDGLLEVHEILGMRLAADLVTLSACDTALGAGHFTELPAGDDFLGFTRAFLSAGSSSVLASLWPVNDRATVDFMKGFYEGVAHRGKARALAETQRRRIHDGGDYAHPFYWASFVLVGEMD